MIQMVGIVIHPDGRIASSGIPLSKLLMNHSIEIDANGRTYTLFHDPSSRIPNTIITDLLGYQVDGPVVVVQRYQSQYITPSKESVLALTGTEIVQKDSCCLL